MEQDSKVCPQCVETVKSAANVCRYCRYDFDADPADKDIQPSPPHQPINAADVDDAEPFFTKEVTIGAIVLLIVGPLLGWGLVHSLNQEQRTNRPDNEETAKRFITKDFLDPASAQFRSLYSSDRCVTGDVNGKNSFGAFIGFKDFYYDVYKGAGRIAPDLDNDPPSFDVGGFEKSLAEQNRYDFEKLVCINGEEDARELQADADRIMTEDEAKRVERKRRRDGNAL